MSSNRRDVLQFPLSRHHSLDLVRVPSKRRYMLVFSERYGIHRRTHIELSYEEAYRAAKFLAIVDDDLVLEPEDLTGPRGPDTRSRRPTAPSIPSLMSPRELDEIQEDELEPTTDPVDKFAPPSGIIFLEDLEPDLT